MVFLGVLMRKLYSVFCIHLRGMLHFNNSLTVDISNYDKIFVPLHCQKEIEITLPREKKDSPTCTKKISHVWQQINIDLETKITKKM